MTNKLWYVFFAQLKCLTELGLLISKKLTQPQKKIDMVEKQGITEELKAKDQMAWVGTMENIKYSAEECIYYGMI